MESTLLILIKVTFLVATISQKATCQDSLQRVYRLINERLESQSAHDISRNDIDKNMAKLNELAKERIGDDPNVRLGFGKLLALEIVDGPQVCSDRSFDLMLTNDHGTGGRARLKELPEDSRRIDFIVQHHLKKRAQLCQPVWAKNFREIHNHMLAEGELVELESFLDKLIERPMQETLEYSLSEVAAKVDMATLSKLLTSSYDRLASQDAELIYRRLEEEAENDADRSVVDEIKKLKSRASISNKNALRQRLIVNSIVKPCQDYTSLLGPKVFEPAMYEERLLSERLNEPDFFDFYLGWARYKLCSYLASHQQQLYDTLLS